jgi:hypothetical protein
MSKTPNKRKLDDDDATPQKKKGAKTLEHIASDKCIEYMHKLSTELPIETIKVCIENTIPFLVDSSRKNMDYQDIINRVEYVHIERKEEEKARLDEFTSRCSKDASLKAVFDEVKTYDLNKLITEKEVFMFREECIDHALTYGNQSYKAPGDLTLMVECLKKVLTQPQEGVEETKDDA